MADCRMILVKAAPEIHMQKVPVFLSTGLFKLYQFSSYALIFLQKIC